MPQGIRKPGEFCWINLLTPDPAAAREFFGRLLGWTYVELPDMGHLVQVDGHDIGGLFDLQHPNTPAGTPPVIGVMVKVESADDAAARVNALGGRAMPPFDIGERGRMAVCFDPNGAEFDVWQGNRSPGTDVDSTAQGAPSWFETMTTNVGLARTFYSELFGWTWEARQMPQLEYTTFKLGEEFVAGLHGITPEMGNIPPHWTTYFTVHDVDASAALAQELGATLPVPLMHVPGVGRFCMLRSPQGVFFHIIAYER